MPGSPIYSVQAISAMMKIISSETSLIPGFVFVTIRVNNTIWRPIEILRWI